MATPSKLTVRAELVEALSFFVPRTLRLEEEVQGPSTKLRAGFDKLSPSGIEVREPRA